MKGYYDMNLNEHFKKSETLIENTILVHVKHPNIPYRLYWNYKERYMKLIPDYDGIKKGLETWQEYMEFDETVEVISQTVYTKEIDKKALRKMLPEQNFNQWYLNGIHVPGPCQCSDCAMPLTDYTEDVK